MAVHQAPDRVRRPIILDDRSTAADAADWREGLPVMSGRTLLLRELRPSDAPSLFAMLASPEASRYISTPPSSIEGVERFIAWTAQERAAGTHACFAIVPHGLQDAVGVIQVRQTDSDFTRAEWGIALGSGYWGRGLFLEAAHLLVAFAFDVLGVSRLEARAAVKNGRANGAMRKLGAVPEGILRRSFARGDEYFDQVLWTILDSDRVRLAPAPTVVH